MITAMIIKPKTFNQSIKFFYSIAFLRNFSKKSTPVLFLRTLIIAQSP